MGYFSAWFRVGAVDNAVVHYEAPPLPCSGGTNKAVDPITAGFQALGIYDCSVAGLIVLAGQTTDLGGGGVLHSLASAG